MRRMAATVASPPHTTLPAHRESSAAVRPSSLG